MHDLLILGAGPAGLTAGIYGARGGLKTVIVERKSFGGQAAITPEVENYPGVQHTDGFTLTFTMEQQARSFGVDFVYDEVESVSSPSPQKITESLKEKQSSSPVAQKPKNWVLKEKLHSSAKESVIAQPVTADSLRVDLLPLLAAETPQLKTRSTSRHLQVKSISSTDGTNFVQAQCLPTR